MKANLNIQQVLAVFELVQLQLKLEDALLADWQVVLMAARADRLHVMHQVILVHQLCRFCPICISSQQLTPEMQPVVLLDALREPRTGKAMLLATHSASHIDQASNAATPSTT